MQSKIALGAFVGHSRACMRLKVQINITARFVNIFDHPAKRLAIKRLTSAANIVHGCLAVEQIVRIPPQRG